MTRILLALGAVLVFGTVNWQIAGKERLRSNGQPVYLELAPIDPRSLMQGDYMALSFHLARDIGDKAPSQDGAAVLQRNERGVGEFVRLDTGAPLASGEMRFRFRLRKGAIWLGTNAFFFQEGNDRRYQKARFGEFHVNDQGEAMLVDLRDKDLRRASEPRRF